MTELYSRYMLAALTAALVLLAVFFLLRGHDLPGGGFVGGLMAAAAIELTVVSLGARHMQARIGRLFVPLAGLGLLLAVGSIVAGFAVAGTVFEGVWLHIAWLELDIGTPLTFDLGVFLVVMSVTALFLLDLTLTLSPADIRALDLEETGQPGTRNDRQGDASSA